MLIQVSVARRVASLRTWGAVSVATDLDRKPMRGHAEIENVSPKRHLASGFHAKR